MTGNPLGNRAFERFNEVTEKNKDLGGDIKILLGPNVTDPLKIAIYSHAPCTPIFYIELICDRIFWRKLYFNYCVLNTILIYKYFRSNTSIKSYLPKTIFSGRKLFLLPENRRQKSKFIVENFLLQVTEQKRSSTKYFW